MNSLIQRVLSDPNLYPKKKTSEMVNGKPVYSSSFNPDSFYQEGNSVYCDFVSGEGSKMRYKYRYSEYNTSAFCEKHNVPLEDRPTGQPFEMLVVSAEFVS
jgi:hypothetical protein